MFLEQALPVKNGTCLACVNILPILFLPVVVTILRHGVVGGEGVGGLVGGGGGGGHVVVGLLLPV